MNNDSDNKERYAICGCQDEFDKDVWHYALTFNGFIFSDIRVDGTKTPEEALLQIKEAMVKYKLEQIQEDF